TSLITRENISTEVSLNQVINKTMTEFLDQSREKHAVITWDNLPVIKGNEEQLILLFRSLLDNAFKFAKPGESPEITISYRLVEGSNEENYGKRGPVHRIIMQDQGIGFSNEFAEKIFLIFQRLHTHRAGYRGKGVGLAIAQRIVANHNGSILARGRINECATFIIYLPVE